MLIHTYEFLNQLQAECALESGDGQLVWTPPLYASMQIFVFEDAWIEEVFNPFWWEYMTIYRSQRNEPLENNAKRGICDEITERCGSHFSEATRKLMGDVDCRAGAMFARISIPAGTSINNVPGPGGHQNLILATHKNDKVLLSMYEPQNRLRTPLLGAVAGGVVVRAVWV